MIADPAEAWRHLKLSYVRVRAFHEPTFYGEREQRGVNGICYIWGSSSSFYLLIRLDIYVPICYMIFPFQVSIFYTAILQRRSEDSAWQQAFNGEAHAITTLSRIKQRLEIP